MSAVSNKSYWLASYNQLYPPVPKPVPKPKTVPKPGGVQHDRAHTTAQ